MNAFYFNFSNMRTTRGLLLRVKSFVLHLTRAKLLHQQMVPSAYRRKYPSL